MRDTRGTRLWLVRGLCLAVAMTGCTADDDQPEAGPTTTTKAPTTTTTALRLLTRDAIVECLAGPTVSFDPAPDPNATLAFATLPISVGVEDGTFAALVFVFGSEDEAQSVANLENSLQEAGLMATALADGTPLPGPVDARANALVTFGPAAGPEIRSAVDQCAPPA